MTRQRMTCSRRLPSPSNIPNTRSEKRSCVAPDERKLPLREYSQLRYSPGKGIVCEESSTRIFVGTRALFEEHGVPVPADALSEVDGA